MSSSGPSSACTHGFPWPNSPPLFSALRESLELGEISDVEPDLASKIADLRGFYVNKRSLESIHFDFFFFFSFHSTGAAGSGYLGSASTLLAGISLFLMDICFCVLPV